MKKLAIAACAVFGMFAATAQSSIISQKFSDYAGKEDVVKVSVTGKMFSMFANIEGETEEEKEMIEAFSSIRGIEVLAGDNNGQGFLKTSQPRLGDRFDELMSISEKDHEVVMFIDEADAIVNEFIILVEGEQEWAIVDVYGAFDLNVVAKIASEMNMAGLEHYNGKLAEAAREISVYPNPANTDKGTKITVTEPLVGSDYQVMDSQGRVYASGTLRDKTTEISLAGLASGNYIITLTKDNAKLHTEKLVVR